MERVVAAAGVLLAKQTVSPFLAFPDRCSSDCDVRSSIAIALYRPCRYWHLRDSPGTTGDDLAAGLALPDANGLPLDGVLSAEGAGVFGVLADFHLLHLLTKRGTVSARICISAIVHCPQFMQFYMNPVEKRS